MPLRASEVAVGTRFEENVVENLTRTQIVQYAGASGDFNRVHTDEVYATEVAGYPSVFAHGLLTMGLVGKVLTNAVGDGRLRSYGARFLSQVWPGDTLTTVAEVVQVRTEGEEHLVDLHVHAFNQDGDEVLAGTATAIADP